MDVQRCHHISRGTNCRSVSDISKLSNDAARLCRKRGYPVTKVNIERFGTINVYPDFILHELLDDYIRTTQRLNGSIMG